MGRGPWPTKGPDLLFYQPLMPLPKAGPPWGCLRMPSLRALLLWSCPLSIAAAVLPAEHRSCGPPLRTSLWQTSSLPSSLRPTLLAQRTFAGCLPLPRCVLVPVPCAASSTPPPLPLPLGCVRTVPDSLSSVSLSVPLWYHPVTLNINALCPLRTADLMSPAQTAGP